MGGFEIKGCIQCDLFDDCVVRSEKVKKMKKKHRRDIVVDSRLYGVGLSKLGIAGGVYGLSGKVKDLIALDQKTM